MLRSAELRLLHHRLLRSVLVMVHRLLRGHDQGFSGALFRLACLRSPPSRAVLQFALHDGPQHK